MNDFKTRMQKVTQSAVKDTERTSKEKGNENPLFERVADEVIKAVTKVEPKTDEERRKMVVLLMNVGRMFSSEKEFERVIKAAREEEKER